MTEHTPTLEQVREAYGWTGHDNYVESNRAAKRAEFDRFIRELTLSMWQEGFRDGWRATGDGWNGEYPDEGKSWEETVGYQEMRKAMGDDVPEE